jgi:hypothetical protein
MEQKKEPQPQPAEVSLKYISWNLKDLLKEMQEIRKVLEEIRDKTP